MVVGRVGRVLVGAECWQVMFVAGVDTGSFRYCGVGR